MDKEMIIDSVEVEKQSVPTNETLYIMDKAKIASGQSNICSYC